jgi:hypothetical protein
VSGWLTFEGTVEPLERGGATCTMHRLTELVAAASDAAWEALPPGRRRGVIARIEGALTGATRTRRRATLVADLAAERRP